MGNIRVRQTDPKNIQREKEAQAKSKQYRNSSITTYQYLRLPRSEQERINRECDKVERENKKER